MPVLNLPSSFVVRLLAGLTLYLAFYAASVVAGPMKPPIEEFPAEAVPRSLQEDPYAFDPGFSGGKWQTDYFPIPAANRRFRGRTLVRLDNGDVIVVGVVPAWGQDDPANGRWNIGLVRYDATGSRVAWSASTVHHFWGFFVVFPNINAPAYYDVIDAKVNGERLYVLADVRHSDNDRDVHVVTFNLNGSYVGTYQAMDTGLDEYGGGLAFGARPGTPPFGGPVGELYVTGTTHRSTGGNRAATLMRFTVASDGSLSRDNNLGPSGNQRYVYHQPAVNGLPRQAVSRSIAVTVGLGNYTRRIYLGGAVLYDDLADWDFLTIAVNPNGVSDTSFGGVGFRSVHFNAGGSKRDVAEAIVARSLSVNGQIVDEVYLAGAVQRRSDSRGVGVVKIGHDGSPVLSFGNYGLGRAIFGGCSSSSVQFPCLGGNSDRETRSMSLNGGRLAIVGTEYLSIPPQSCFFPPCARMDNATLAIVRADGGALTEDTYLQLFDADGTRRNSYAWDVVPAGANRFTVTGTGELSAPRAFITARVSSDRIFGDGFAH